MSKALCWVFHHDGSWSTRSQIEDDNGVTFEWIIAICDDGTFSVNESDGELTREAQCFATLASAKSYCEEREAGLLEGTIALGE